MLKEEKLVEILRTLPEFVDGANFHIYPQYVPGAVVPDKCVTYTLLSETRAYTQKTAKYQLLIITKDYSEGKELAVKVADLFNTKVYSTAGDFISMALGQINELPYDTQNKLYYNVVEVIIKTT